MSGLEETCFLQHLTDIDSVAFIVAEGVHEDILPSPEAKEVYRYAIDYYFDSGKTRAVTPGALQTYEVKYGSSLLDLLESIEVDITEDPELSIADVIEKLKGRYIVAQSYAFVSHFGKAVTEVSTQDRLKVVTESAAELMVLISRLTPRRTQMDARQGVEERVKAYHERTKGSTSTEGLGLGLADIDAHTLRVHPGEVMIFGAFSKVGKSMWSIMSALGEWRRERDTALFTLENPMEMTLDRICCAAVAVDSERWQKGECSSIEVDNVEKFRDLFLASKNTIHVIHSPKGQRSVEFMLRQSQALDVDSVIIDQISHIEHPDPGRKPRWELVRDIMQDLHVLAGSAELPVLAFHQISRDGKREADKRGFHVMEDFAESSEVERSADFAVMQFQSREMRAVNQALLQLVGARRCDLRKWMIDWYPGMGHARVKGQV